MRDVSTPASREPPWADDDERLHQPSFTLRTDGGDRRMRRRLASTGLMASSRGCDRGMGLALVPLHPDCGAA
jgi:hypothetical protein